MSNYLKNTTSPYLLQHAENPVEWYPWCDEAFEKAKIEDKPIFLSIGYSTCHWCHVMANESFENRDTAKILNEHFISIKVDREERPDIDSVYMSVCQAFTGSGGWPMSIFMTWDKKPFFAGTYFPVRARYGIPGFTELLDIVIKQWDNNRQELLRSANQVISHLKQAESGHNVIGDKNLCDRAVQMFCDSFDNINGGFGSAPKFPMPHSLLFLTLYALPHNNADILRMVEKTLTQMRKGGIFDHIGGGFARYSTDQYFLAPHFEKMLYDNALLIIAYATAFWRTKNTLYLDTAEKTADYIIREMTSPDGGFYSAQDADSEGIEGKFYTFTLSEVLRVLGEEKGKPFAEKFDITADGNFEGVNIPNLLKSNDWHPDFCAELQTLYNYRKKRTKLHLDDKILTSWNSMMIAALSILYRVSHNNNYLQTAINAQRFIEKNLNRDLSLYTSWREGKHSNNGFLDDYAFYVTALMELYHSTLNKEYLEKAEVFCMEAVKRFADKENGGFFLSQSDNSELIINPKEIYDGAVPSGNSVMAYNLIRLYQLTEKEEYHFLAQKQNAFMSAEIQESLTGHSMFLLAKMLYDNPPAHIVAALENVSDLDKIRKQLPLLANITTVLKDKEYPLINGRTTFYICKNHTCLAPTNSYDPLS